MGLESYIQKRDYQLVLDSRHIPFRLSHFCGREHIYVPPLLVQIAQAEILAYNSENRIVPPKIFRFPIYRDCALAVFFTLPLILWYGLQHGWWPTFAFFPDPQTWQSLGMLDSAKVFGQDQWHRIATALSLHSDLSHLFGNVVFGAFFLAFLARIAGVGRAFFLTIVAACCGNAASLFLHGAVYKSLGFSTALFACLGILAGFTAFGLSLRKKALMPVAAALALVAMLGTSGEKTDYIAHLCGLFSGMVLGLWEAFRIRHKLPALPQFWAGLTGMAILFGAWIFAFR